MPSFTIYNVDAEVDVDIDVDEYLSECSDDEITEIIDALIEDGYLKSDDNFGEGKTLMENLFFKQCNGLKGAYMQISNEDIEIIEQIYKKYC